MIGEEVSLYPPGPGWGEPNPVSTPPYDSLGFWLLGASRLGVHLTPASPPSPELRIIRSGSKCRHSLVLFLALALDGGFLLIVHFAIRWKQYPCVDMTVVVLLLYQSVVCSFLLLVVVRSGVVMFVPHHHTWHRHLPRHHHQPVRSRRPRMK